MKKIAIFQPPFLPWPCFFEIINEVDTFVFFDDVQFTKQNYLSRNFILHQGKKKMINVNIRNKNSKKAIKDIELSYDLNWHLKQYKTLLMTYKNKNFFYLIEPILEKIFLQKWKKLVDLNIYFIKEISSLLNLKTKWLKSSEMNVEGEKNGTKILNICEQLNCNHIFNGPTSLKYLDLELFVKKKIKLSIMKNNIKVYNQGLENNLFITNLSIIDAISNCGLNKTLFMKSNNYDTIL